MAELDTEDLPDGKKISSCSHSKIFCRAIGYAGTLNSFLFRCISPKDNDPKPQATRKAALDI